MISQKGLLTLEASGSNLDIGVKVGKKCRLIISRRLAESRRRLEESKISWVQAIERSREFVPYSEEYNPDYIEFVKGFSKGSGQNFEDLFVLLVEGEKGLCTDIAVNQQGTADGSVLHAHSEDWRTTEEKNYVLLRARPRGGPSCIVLTLGGLEWIAGMNSAGLTLTGNAVYPNDTRIGVPNLMVAHKIISCRRLGEAIAAAVPPHRASSLNNNICHPSGELYSVEASATDFAVINGIDGYIVHANHYIHPRMTGYESLFGNEGNKSLKDGTSSIVRYNRALRLMKSQFGEITVESLKAILEDHVNRPGSICRHLDIGAPQNEKYKTNIALIIDPTNLRMHVCVGNPCVGKFVEHKL
jgi:isopenicillin-N N-acyltransferase-like protein